jgi:hypothetical protein
MKRGRLFGWLGGGVAIVGIALLFAGAAGVDYYTSTAEFCGNTCHVMKAAYESWKVSEHKDLNCLDCHATSDDKPLPLFSFQGLRQAYSYVMRDGEHPRIRPVISDQSCAASGCHSGKEFLKEDSTFKKREGIRFIHLTHKVKAFDQLQPAAAEATATPETPVAAATPTTIPGHELHCDTCHVSNSQENHFEVPKEVCFLCHFKKQGFNEGRSKCALCHDIPGKPLQRQKQEGDEGAITHQKLIENGVACQSCHVQVVAGMGEINTTNCRDCHFVGEVLAKTGREHMELLHAKHVAGQQASCFDCHQPIRHKNEGDFLDLVRLDCQQCHPDHHRFQKTLLSGPPHDGVPATPNPMFAAKTNCRGCHLKEGIHRGQPFFIGSERACVGCHTEAEGELLSQWRASIAKEIDYAVEVEQEALAALKAGEGQVAAEQLGKAQELLAKGQENLHIVQYGNGVHNKKYALLLLDAAITHFQDATDMVGK